MNGNNQRLDLSDYPEKIQMDKTIFRVYPNGEVIALFPQIAARLDGYMCQSYMHVGQHGAANPHWVVNQTKLATAEQYSVLLTELEQIGYNPVVGKKFTRKDSQIRCEQVEGAIHETVKS